ncbi:MAG: FAD-dependent oxidoreductase [Chloroflexi bacterium]|nr:FAD-dependent oxidoreductase [Chloroflexota bacterium]
MADQFPYLFTPFQLGNLTLRNRIVFLPHLSHYATQGYPTETQAYYYGERAKGGAGFILTECQSVHPVGRQGTDNILAWDKAVIPGLRRISEMAHEYGARISGQLVFGGPTTTLSFPQLLWGPSTVPDPFCHIVTKEMTRDDLREVKEHFAQAAANEMEGGMDGVELKIAHDGLLRNFLSPYFNKRTDEYGGSFENRMRFPLEVVAAVRRAIGPEPPLGIRLCLDEFLSGGYGLEEGVEFAKAFAGSGEVTYISGDAGTWMTMHIAIPPMCFPLGFAVYMTAAVKEAVDAPVIAFGRINDPVQAEKILTDGHADLIGMARQLICDPEWPNKAKDGRIDDIRNCVACNDGCLGRLTANVPIRCVQNPASGREKELGSGTLKPATVKKEVMVVGGGPAGLKVAEIAARRGHRVSLYEKEGELGGQVNVAVKASQREELGGIVRWIKGQVENLGVDIHLNTEVTPGLVEKVSPDVLVVATGSVPERPSFGGADQENVISVKDALLGVREVGQRVIVYDDDHHWPGASAAETLLDQGRKVEIVTSDLHVGSALEVCNFLAYYPRVLGKGAVFSPMLEIKEVSGTTVTVSNVYTGEERRIEEVDTVVVAAHNRSVNDLYEALAAKVKEVYLVGDAAAPRKIIEAIYEAELIGRGI